jgi:hypothetical protein
MRSDATSTLRLGALIFPGIPGAVEPLKSLGRLDDERSTSAADKDVNFGLQKPSFD